MPGLNGVEVTKIIRKEFPKIKIIALTSYFSKPFILNMISIGAVAYLAKNSTPQLMVKTIEEVSKAIGRGGNNIKLASLLTGYEIDVIREGIAQEEDDVELREFSDEIEAWIIEEFEKIGLDTARSVLNQDVADLVRRTDLEEETILDVMNILKEELEG